MLHNQTIKQKRTCANIDAVHFDSVSGIVRLRAIDFLLLGRRLANIVLQSRGIEQVFDPEDVVEARRDCRTKLIHRQLHSDAKVV